MLKKSLQSCLLLKKIEAVEGSTATQVQVRPARQLISDILTLFFLKGCFLGVWLASMPTISVLPDLTSDKANQSSQEKQEAHPHAACRVVLTVIKRDLG